MRGDRIAVIDMGSNTFHLLICEINEEGALISIYKERVYVKLASGGLDHIGDESMLRARDAMIRFADLIRLYRVNHTRAIGTAALREAKNGNDIARILTASSGIPIEIIDGDTEAGYIFRGIKSGVPQLDKPALIMDIGGGSVEFILFQDHQILFKGSYKIGVALLYRKFHQGDPITPEAIRAIEDLLETELAEVLKTVGKSGAYYLIGASGSFEVIQDVLPKKQSAEHWSELDINTIDVYLDKIIRADLETRRIMPEIPEERLDYIVIAYILIRYIFKQIPPEKLFYCDFAVKEGILAEMMESL